jgi:TolA-binding protein
MADNQNIPNQASGQSFHHELEARFHHLRQEFLPKHGTKLLVGILVIAAGVVGLIQYQAKTEQATAALNQDLGKAYSHLYGNKSDSAAVVLEGMLAKSGISGLPEAKAALLLGNIQFQKGDFDAAGKSFERSRASAGDVELIRSGAEHGLATVSIEKKDYTKAVQQLESFVKTYGKRSGNLEDRFTQKEQVDPIVTVPDALWKLTLCYVELKQTDKAKVTADNLIKIYGESRQATSARKLLATL